MKTAAALMVMLMLAVLAGCRMSPRGRTSIRGGSMFKKERFSIAVPTFDTTLKQGEVQTVTISLRRAADFNQDVTLQVNASKGIRVEPARATVKASDNPDVQLQIHAAKDAGIGEYHVQVKGTPATGETVSVEFKVNIVAR